MFSRFSVQLVLKVTRLLRVASITLVAFVSHPIHTASLNTATDWLFSPDMELSVSSIAYSQPIEDTEWQVSVGHARMNLDFISPDIFTRPATIREDRWSFQSQALFKVIPHLEVRAGLQAFAGFATYAGAWLHEFYRQRYGSFGYLEVDPYGVQGNLSTRWEYLPGNGYLDVGFSQIRQRIAPGAEFTGTLQLGNEHLNTSVLTIATENVLSPRIRSKLSALLTDTTDRDLRALLQAEANLSLGERWVARTTAGWTSESPEFDATFVSLTLEFALRPHWLLFLTGRHYHDTGQIENSLLFSTAAPGLETRQLGVGMHYLWDRSALKLYLAPYVSRYDPIDQGTEFFGQLYRDRDWWLIQLAYSWEF